MIQETINIKVEELTEEHVCMVHLFSQHELTDVQYHNIMADAGIDQIASLCENHDGSVRALSLTHPNNTSDALVSIKGTPLPHPWHPTRPAPVFSCLFLSLALLLH